MICHNMLWFNTPFNIRNNNTVYNTILLLKIKYIQQTFI